MSPNYVFVIDKEKTPLTPTHPAKARKLLTQGRAAVFRLFPFTIILKRKVIDVKKETKFQLKIDPGSKTTGLAIVKNNLVLWAGELTHRGEQIKLRLEKRRMIRRSRRQRKTRYRKARFLNRKRPSGWLPPSLMSRVHPPPNPLPGGGTKGGGWVRRLCKVCPMTGLSQELVRFDTQALQNPEISGTEYQQGELFGYEVREYLLEKWGRKCAYCNAENVSLEIEHIKPRSKGGSNRVSNLTIACRVCNLKKGNREIEEFLCQKPSLLKHILGQTKKSLANSAAVNSTRGKLYEELKKILPTEVGSGGLTKYNRRMQKLPKTHWIDAACVGKTPNLKVLTNQPLLISAKGNCNRLVVQMDKFGFPRQGYKPKQKVPHWNTGDIVNVIAGKQAGLRNLRLKTVRHKGNFDIKLSNKKVISVSRNQMIPVHRADGYSYSFGQL